MIINLNQFLFNYKLGQVKISRYFYTSFNLFIPLYYHKLHSASTSLIWLNGWSAALDLSAPEHLIVLKIPAIF